MSDNILDSKFFLDNQAANRKDLKEKLAALVSNEGKICRNISEIVHKANKTGPFLPQDKREEQKNDKRSRLTLSLIYIISVLFSIMLGWVTGYFALKYDPVLTVALIGIISGMILGWYYAD